MGGGNSLKAASVGGEPFPSFANSEFRNTNFVKVLLLLFGELKELIFYVDMFYS